MQGRGSLRIRPRIRPGNVPAGLGFGTVVLSLTSSLQHRGPEQAVPLIPARNETV